MMQTLRSSDVLRCILLNVPKGPNMAYSMEGLACGKAVSKSIVWKETLAGRRQRVTLAQWDGFHLAGLASAKVSFHTVGKWIALSKIWTFSVLAKTLSMASSSARLLSCVSVRVWTY